MIIYKVGHYHPNDSMSDLICDNYAMLLVMSRFGINLGFGEDSIEECCKKNRVDVTTFLAVVNLLISTDKKGIKVDHERVSLLALMEYLYSSHRYFVDYRLPLIRQKLIDSIAKDDDLSVVIINYYDEYLAEVKKHMIYEEQTLFPYITSLAKGIPSSEYNIAMFCKHHDKVEAKLSEFKNIIIKYYPSKSTNELNGVLYDIFSCESDLVSHSQVEDFLLVPIVESLESSNN